jgi:hypothetical protein
MNEQDILKIVEDAFDNQITTKSEIAVHTEFSEKHYFLKEVSDKLKKLFEDNDLTK